MNGFLVPRAGGGLLTFRLAGSGDVIVTENGKVVKPDVYIAAGISGATQHLVVMKGSKHIIAINKDAEAPIFSVADLGIVGDVHKVLPKLIEAIQAR